MKKVLLCLIFAGAIGIGYSQIYDISEPRRLPDAVNSSAEESTPLFSADSSLLFFTRTFDERNAGGKLDQDIWFSTIDKAGNYSLAQPLKTLNNKFNNAVVSINKKGDVLYLLNAYEGKKDMEKGLAYSEKKNGNWSSPVKVIVPGLDIDGDYYGFHVNGTEDVMIISYAGPGTLGSEDLYVSLRTAEAWSSPQHLGNVINTSGFEISPFLKGDTLYFSSNGHGGLGDADIFYSVKQGSWTEWSTPVNMGPKINTDKFDAYFSYSNDNLYWSSNRDGGYSNIYHAKVLPPPTLSLSCSSENVTLYNANDGKLFATASGAVGELTYSWSNGIREQNPVGMPPGEYTVTVTDGWGRTASCSTTIVEPPKPVAQKKIQEEVYFDLNSSYLNAEIIAQLDDFIKRIKEMPELKIFIESHCDIRADEEYNMWLSERRMKRIIEYFENNGIEPNRVSGDYKGKSEPKIKCTQCTEEEHRLNRRTTILTL
jgi:outer membrane protein OmpA-like peptidoglycan-associated protein